MPASPPIAAPAFGAWLESLRGPRSLEQIAKKVRPHVEPIGLKVDQSLIYKIEKGRVPSWPMLGALCRVYGVDIREATHKLIDALQFPGAADLLCPTTGVQRASGRSDGGIVYDTDADRLLAEDIDHLRAIANNFFSQIDVIRDRLRSRTNAPHPHTTRPPAQHKSTRPRRGTKAG